MVDAFLLAFGVILLAELGDKSQLLTLAFATRYPAWMVLLGVSIGALVMQAVAVVLGSTFALVLPTALIQVAAGVAFFGFAGWSLRGDIAADEHVAAVPWRGGLTALALAGAFVVAEVGDKTMLVTLTLATTQDGWGTWLGASAGMIGVNVLVVAIGSALGARLPARAIRLLAAAAFAVFGALLVAEGLGLL